jgi:regulator of sigma E protease
LGDNTYYTVKRNNKLTQVRLPANLMDKLADAGPGGFVEVRFPFTVDSVLVKKPGLVQRIKSFFSTGDNSENLIIQSGLVKGDTIKMVNGQSIKFYDEFTAALQNQKGKKVKLLVNRAGQTVDLTVQLDEEGKVGFYPKPLINFVHRDFTLTQAIPKGTNEAISIITNQLRGFKKIFKGEASASKSVGGPIMIAQTFGGTFTWVKFWTIVGMLSMVLAFMNFLPIPALDGGHVMFLTYEMVSGQKPSDKFLENAQKVGMVLLLGLMTFAIFNDVFKLFS